MNTRQLKKKFIYYNDKNVTTLIWKTFNCLVYPLLIFAHSQICQAQSNSYKLSTAVYSTKDPSGMTLPGFDTNLRSSSQWGNTWLGFYETQGKEIQQSRIGWDNSYQLNAFRVLPSLQSATGGFLGTSLGLETGEDFFLGVAIGRTNLKNYVNLNFDPNDAWSFSSGYRWSQAHQLGIQIVHDNRQNPDQQHAHLSYRQELAHQQQILIDLLYKTGTVDNNFIKEYGILLGFESHDWGLRLAYDPRVNFTNTDMRRLIFFHRF